MTAVTIYRVEDGAPSFESQDILWKIENGDSSGTTSFAIGEAPEGFDESVRLRGPLEEENEVSVIVDIEMATQAVVQFRPEDLRSDSVFSHVEYSSLNAFITERQDRCGA